jgi:hypothetical protein
MKRTGALSSFEPVSKSPVENLHPGNALLRRAIQENAVSFPSQIPVLFKQTDHNVQWRVVVLFLVRAWSMNAIGRRVGLPASRVSLIVREWSVRAFALGYIQIIDPVRFSEITGDEFPAPANAVFPPIPISCTVHAGAL